MGARGHGARHLIGTGLKQARVEAIIETAAREALVGATVGTWFSNLQVVVDGIPIIYRGFVLSSTVLRVGTYFLKTRP